MTTLSEAPESYRRRSLIITFSLLATWAVLSLGCGVVFRDSLDQAFPKIGGAPFGFWMAQQGSIIGFVLILIIYAILMNQLDRKFGYSEEA